MVIAIAVPLIGGLNMTPENNQLAWHILWEAIAIGALLFLLIVIKTWLEYRRRMYDPTLIREFQKEFDSIEEKRSEAARVCIAFLKRPMESRKWEAISKHEREKVNRF